MINAKKPSPKDIVPGVGVVKQMPNTLRLVTKVNDGTCHYRQLDIDDGCEIDGGACSAQSMVRWCDRIATKTEIAMINLEDSSPAEKRLREVFNQFMPDGIKERKRSGAAGSEHKILHFDFEKGDTLPGRLEETVNIYAEPGWEVVSFTANDVETGPLF